MTWLAIGDGLGLVGLAHGLFIPSNFVPSDLVTGNPCDDFLLTNVQIPGCSETEVEVPLDVTGLGEFNGLVTLNALDLDPGVVARFTPNPAPAGKVTLTLDAPNPIASLDLRIVGEDETGTIREILLAEPLFNSFSGQTQLLEPLHGSTDLAGKPMFTWLPVPGATSYELEIARDQNFADLVETTSVEGNSSRSRSYLMPVSDYFWRIRSRNPCAMGDWSVARSFSTGDYPEYHLEMFESQSDLSHHSLDLEPVGGTYDACMVEAQRIPVDPEGGTPLFLSNSGSQEVPLPFPFTLYGQTYNSVFVGANGYLTFGSGDRSILPLLQNHFSVPRIAAFFYDFHPSLTDTVTYKNLPGKFVVTYLNMPYLDGIVRSTVQVELFERGRIRLTFLALGTGKSIIGLSDGLVAGDYSAFTTDLSLTGSCDPCNGLDQNGNSYLDEGDLPGNWARWLTPKNGQPFSVRELVDLIERYGRCSEALHEL